jgi:hypothetical protein
VRRAVLVGVGVLVDVRVGVRVGVALCAATACVQTNKNSMHRQRFMAFV